MLQPASRYEAAAEFWPQYLRGQAYQRSQSGNEAAAEFRKILDHRGQAVLLVLYETDPTVEKPRRRRATRVDLISSPPSY